MAISIHRLIDDAKCYEMVRELRWPNGVCCPHVRSWLRPHRGISQENLPLYLAFFEFTHNVRQRGKALFESLIATLVKPST